MIECALPGSALHYSMHGEAAYWTLTDHLLAVIADRLAAANWQRGGGKGRKPEPIPRPGMGKKGQPQDVARRKPDAMTIEEFERRYAERRAHDQDGG